MSPRYERKPQTCRAVAFGCRHDVPSQQTEWLRRERLAYMAEVVVFGVVAADVVLRVPRIPAPGDQVNAEPLGWRIGGSSANVACGLSSAGHHVRLVGPVGSDSMGG